MSASKPSDGRPSASADIAPAAAGLMAASPSSSPFRASGAERPNDSPSGVFECRPGCAACCIAPSISSRIPGMPGGKPAGARCVQLTLEGLCRLFGMPERPAVCGGLRPSAEMCGETSAHAMEFIARLEAMTAPAAPPAPPAEGPKRV